MRVDHVGQHRLRTPGEAVPGRGADTEADRWHTRLLQLRQRGAEPGAVQESIMEGHDLARYDGITAVARPRNVVAAEHDGVHRGEQRVDVEGRFAALEQQMRQDWTDGDDSV